MVLIRITMGKYEKKLQHVSVPLRGLWFLSSLKWFYIAGAGFAVSVPLRGLWFLSTWKRLRCATTTSSFRPLAGIMVLIVIPLSSNTFKNSSFRPLAGIMVLIKQGTKIPCLGTAGFPSPCGDYGSYHVRNVGNISKRTNSFPSPCGDYGSYRFYIGQRPSSGQDRRKLHLYVDLERLT